MDAKKALATGAAGMLLAVGGGVPAIAASARGVGSLSSPVGSVFSGTVEVASTEGILVERRSRRQGAQAQLVAVDIDSHTVVSRAGQALSLKALASGTEVIVSGTKTEEGTVLASKILIRG